MSLKEFLNSIKHQIEENKDLSSSNRLAKEMVNECLKDEENSIILEDMKDYFNEIISILNNPNESLGFIQNTLFLLIFEYLD